MSALVVVIAIAAATATLLRYKFASDAGGSAFTSAAVDVVRNQRRELLDLISVVRVVAGGAVTVASAVAANAAAFMISSCTSRRRGGGAPRLPTSSPRRHGFQIVLVSIKAGMQ